MPLYNFLIRLKAELMPAAATKELIDLNVSAAHKLRDAYKALAHAIADEPTKRAGDPAGIDDSNARGRQAHGPADLAGVEFKRRHGE
jgi:MinD-like ATPase involved in chromosome partitioning or flagellar assembly